MSGVCNLPRVLASTHHLLPATLGSFWFLAWTDFRLKPSMWTLCSQAQALTRDVDRLSWRLAVAWRLAAACRRGSVLADFCRRRNCRSGSTDPTDTEALHLSPRLGSRGRVTVALRSADHKP